VSNYGIHRAWADKFMPIVRKLIGYHLIIDAPKEEDEFHNTDLMTITQGSVRIGVRLRRFDQYEKFKDGFTIRSKRESGNKTELEKIIEGWGDYFFYGFVNKEETSFIDWYLLDLKVFRSILSRWYKNGKKLNEIPMNGEAAFLGLKLSDFPDTLIVGRKNEIKIEKAS